MSEQLDETSTGNTDTAEATVAAEQPLMRFVWARLDEASQRTPSRLSNYFTRDLEAKRAIVLDHSAVHDLSSGTLSTPHARARAPAGPAKKVAS
jgi:hypothetical protein